MNVMRTKGVVLLLAGITALAIPGGTVYASCGSAPISHGSLGAPGFFNCGPDPSAFAWEHKRSVQRIIGNLSTSGDTVAGQDSGNKQNLADSMMLPGSVPGSYFGQTDFSNPGWDG